MTTAGGENDQCQGGEPSTGVHRSASSQVPMVRSEADTSGAPRRFRAGVESTGPPNLSAAHHHWVLTVTMFDAWLSPTAFTALTTYA